MEPCGADHSKLFVWHIVKYAEMCHRRELWQINSLGLAELLHYLISILEPAEVNFKVR